MRLDLEKIDLGMKNLKELKETNLLDVVEHLSDGSYRLKPNVFPRVGAVYAFWWTGSLNRFMDEDVNRIISFKGPKG